MPTIEQVRDVLATINDPELHRSIVELGMVKGIEVSAPQVTVDLALTIPGCPLKSFFQEVLPAKIQATFPEITQVTVNLGAMTDEERKALVGGVKAQAPLSFAQPDSHTTVLAIGSGKGGVGKSTVAANLAAGLAKRGYSVGLLDADIWGFSSSRMVGISAKPTVIDERLIVPLEAYGFKMISMGNLVEDDRPIVMRGPMLHKILQSFLSDVHWEEPDYLLIDMPPGTGDISLSLSQFVPGCSIVLITTPQQAAEKVAERAGHMAAKVGMKVAGVIENMAYSICEHCGERTHPFGTGGGQELADTFAAPLLGQIPLDPPMGELADRGKPSVVASPESPSAQAFEELTDALVQLIPPRPKGRSRKPLPLIMAPPAPPRVAEEAARSRR
ncbi:MAG TPA: Mrp/NBP35 family ATP-binding protein [Actinomycetota bacterium]|nr:Mrp/NBP35 family ATP-binding protein [Actinomycetota bacterium]